MPGMIQAPLQRMGRQRLQNGAASLVVVMLLFFVVALVSAYTSRNLIFEQRTSVNQYRSTLAFEAAEAGVEWALGMLSAGRIGNDCTEASATATSTSFRQRYLNIDPNTGVIRARLQPSTALPLLPSCIWNPDADNWACSCPSDGNPTLVAAAANGHSPAFSLRFVESFDGADVAIRVQVNACVRVTSATDPCLTDFSETSVESDGRAQHSAQLTLKTALTTPPTAALTVFGSVIGGGAASLRNTDAASGGTTLHAAGTVDSTTFNIYSVPGTPSARSVYPGDAKLIPHGLTLADLEVTPAVPLTWSRVFGSTFGLLPASFRDQPAAIRLPCPNAGCRQALSDLVAANPQRVIWVQGDLVLETAGTVGTLPDPAVANITGPATIVVEGRVRFLDPNVQIFGLVYARNGDWTGSGTITGAAMVEGELSATAAPTVNFDPAVLQAIRLTSGSFVLLPGGWKDFK